MLTYYLKILGEPGVTVPDAQMRGAEVRLKAFDTILEQTTDADGNAVQTFRTGIVRSRDQSGDGAFDGFIWKREFTANPGEESAYQMRTEWKLAGLEDKVCIYAYEDYSGEPTDALTCMGAWGGPQWKQRYGGGMYYAWEDLLTDIREIVSKRSYIAQYDTAYRLLYCGEHHERVYHGLGAMFFYDLGTAELPGYWLSGVLTHIRLGSRMVSLDGMEKADALKACAILREAVSCSDRPDPFAESDGSEHCKHIGPFDPHSEARAAVQMAACGIRLLTPYREDAEVKAVLSEFYDKLDELLEIVGRYKTEQLQAIVDALPKRDSAE